ncbi:hypothetical protein [Pandoraea sp. ISTKB]|uniref:hypothetical protein n=1 Tax=Pandoraea sp. ISTKB TaxID=1586708 RepID=UPI000846E0D6|nr:hypothetical protein [Pandoraea sp. ISTKB]ODP35547.1 hypothetical protein A9762_00585 [Pandoraea sp. ISTKB]
MAKADPTSADVSAIDLSLVQGDLGFHLQRRLRLIPDIGMGTVRRALQLPLSAVLGKVVKALV